MKNIIKLSIVAVAVCALGGMSFAQGTTPAPAKPAAPAKTTEKKETTVKITRGRGELVAVDSKTGTAKIKSPNSKEMTFIADSKETKDALAKVKVGDSVRVGFIEKDGKFVLQSLEKSRPRTESKSSRQKTEKTETTKPAK